MIPPRFLAAAPLLHDSPLRHASCATTFSSTMEAKPVAKRENPGRWAGAGQPRLNFEVFHGHARATCALPPPEAQLLFFGAPLGEDYYRLPANRTPSWAYSLGEEDPFRSRSPPGGSEVTMQFLDVHRSVILFVFLSSGPSGCSTSRTKAILLFCLIFR